MVVITVHRCEGQRQDERLEGGARVEGGDADGRQPLGEVEVGNTRAAEKGRVADGAVCTRGGMRRDVIPVQESIDRRLAE